MLNFKAGQQLEQIETEKFHCILLWNPNFSACQYENVYPTFIGHGLSWLCLDEMRCHFSSIRNFVVKWRKLQISQNKSIRIHFPKNFRQQFAIKINCMASFGEIYWL